MSSLKVTRETGDTFTTYRLRGSLTRENLDILQQELSPDPTGKKARIDLREIEAFDSFGVVSLLGIAGRSEGKVTLIHPSPDLKAFMVKVPFSSLFERKVPRKSSLLLSLGEWLIQAGLGVKHFIALGFEFVYWIGVAPLRGRKIYVKRTIHELNLIGVDAVPIVGLISLLMGIILALNAAYQLEQYGAKIFVANLVALSLTRELSPVITAIIVAGRTGSAIAAELGTMIVTEEIDALRVTGIHPTSFLIVPKLLSLFVALPCLVILSDVVGIMGGMGISVGALELGLTQYYDQTRFSLQAVDVLIGLIKSGIFGLLIGLTGATLGMRLKGGAEEVGRITTSAVVISFFLIILADMLFTLFLTLLGT